MLWKDHGTRLLRLLQDFSEYRAKNNRHGVDYYESLYAEYLCDAFTDGVPQRKFLIYAAQLYHENR